LILSTEVTSIDPPIEEAREDVESALAVHGLLDHRRNHGLIDAL